jgi:hypothetical protein
MAAVAGNAETPLGARIALLFALGDVFDAARRADEAFAAYEEANRLRRGRLIESVDEVPDLAIVRQARAPN